SIRSGCGLSGEDWSEDVTRRQNSARLGDTPGWTIAVYPFAGLLAAGLFSTGFGASCLTAASAAWNPTLLCVPSQNGLFTDPPHLHSEYAGFPVRSYLLPFASNISINPSGSSTR